MIERILYLILSIVFLVSCNNQEAADLPPKGILDKETFAEVLKDQALIESVITSNIKNVNADKFDSTYNFNVYEQNHTTKAQYDSTVKYYSTKPEEFKFIMESVLEKLNVEKSKR